MSRTSSTSDLDRARELFESVVARDAKFAPAWSGLGITHLQYVRHGLGGQMHVMAARRALTRRWKSIRARSRRTFIASTCCSRAARRKARDMASSTCC